MTAPKMFGCSVIEEKFRVACNIELLFYEYSYQLTYITFEAGKLA